MKRIHQLSVNLINQIAAGEVIERPASVVKELVENSIDAGSLKIDIAVSNECRNIRVADNGSGIHPDDVLLTFAKHATSKIEKEEDLWNIKTMGFRGEALASICSISKVTCLSRTKEFDYGIKIVAENSEIKEAKTGCALGTVMQIENIFYNQPARLKFLKSDKTEFSYIQEIVVQAALARPDISFTLSHNDSVILKTNADNELLLRINEITGGGISEKLLPVEKTDREQNIKLSGYVSNPQYTRSAKKDIRVFVNSRPIKCPVVLKAVDTAYKNLLPIGRYPYIVLNFDVPPTEVDINAHPTKKEIRWQNPNLIFNFTVSAIDKALTSQNYRFEKEQNEPSNILPFYSVKENKEDDYFVSNNYKNNFSKNYSVTKPVNYAETFRKISVSSDFGSEKLAENSNSETQNDVILGQLKDTYILIETPEGLEIVDQHIADERYLYEKFLSQKEIVSQMLLISDLVELEPEEVELIETNAEKLSKFGYEIKKVEDNKIVFKRVPQVLSKVPQEEIARELIENINGNLDDTENQILITTACKAAVKAGEKLSIWQAEELIRRWRSTKNPQVCPHGRPISHIIPIKDIAKFFYRQDK